MKKKKKENNLLDNMQSRHPAFLKGNKKILLCKFIENILFFNVYKNIVLV